MGSANSRVTEQRVHERVPLRRRLRVQLEAWDEFAEMYAKDVSEGGVFVHVDEAVELGSRISVEVADARGRALVLAGEVVHRTEAEPATGTRAGVGVRFLPLSDAEREIIVALVNDAREQAVAKAGHGAAPGEVELAQLLRERLRAAELGEPRAVLGVGPTATRDELHRAYAEQLKRWHPSAYANASAEIHELCAAICRAIRRAYDEAARA